MILVVGHAQARAEARGEVMRLSLEHVRRSREEAGCLSHNVSVDAEDECRFVFVEYWQDMPALMAHFALAASRDFVAALGDLLVERSSMKIYAADEITPG